MAAVQSHELKAILRLQDEFSGKLNSIAGTAGSAFATVGKAAAGAGLVVGGALAGGLALGVKSAGDLEQAVANISTIKPEIDTSAVFASLNELSTKVPQSAAQLGDALYDVFSSVNVSQAEGIALTEKFAKSAVGAQTDAKTFGTAAMGVMNAYGLAVADADHISDVFFNTIAAGVVTGEELARGLGPITGSAKAAGVSLDVMGGLMVGVTKQGGDAAQNLNNLNNLLQKITTTDAVKAMKALGVSTTDASGKFREMPDVLGDLKTSLAGLTEAGRANALQSIFPDAQARAGAQTIMDQLDAVNAAIETNKTQSGSAASAYEKMSATFNSQSKILMNTLTSIATTVGAEVLPAITPMITAFSKTLPNALKLAGAFIAGDLAGMFDGLKGLFGNAATTSMLLYVAGIRDGMGKAVKTMQDAGVTFKEALAGNWRPDGVDEAGNVVWVDPFVKKVGEAGASIKTFFDSFSSPEVTESTGQIVTNLRDLGTELDKLTGGGKGAGLKLVGDNDIADLAKLSAQITAFATNGVDLVNTLGEAFRTLGAGIQLSAKGIQQVFTGDWMGAIESTKAAAAEFAKIPGIMDAQLDRADARLRSATPEMAAAAAAAFAPIPTEAAAALVPLGPTVEAAMDTAAAFLPRLTDGVLAERVPMDAAATALGAALETQVDAAILETIANAGASLPGIPQAVTDQHAVMFSASTTLGEQLQTPLAAGVLAAIADTEAKMPGVSAAVSAEQGPAGSAGTSVGQSIVSGLGNALSAGLGWVGERASALANEAIRRANEALGNPHSPSPVFLAIGATIPQGLAAGIQQGVGMVSSAVSGVIGSAIGAGQKFALPGQRGGGPAPGTLTAGNPGQFGIGLSWDAAAAACGPYAALVFANATGRTPTAEEVVSLARSVGWTPGAGMAGPGSEVALLGKMGINAVQQAATTGNIRDAFAAGSPVAISTPRHYFAATGMDEAGNLDVGGSGTALKGGSTKMSLAAIGSLGGGLQSIIRLAGNARDQMASYGAAEISAAAATNTLSAAQADSNKWAETMAAEQTKLSEVMRGHVDPDLIHMTDAMTNFGAVLGPIERQVAGGSVSMETLRFKLVDLARATGLASTPWADYNAGLIDMDEAMMRVVTDSASAGPQFEALRQQLGTTNTITNEGTLQWLQLALAMGKVVPVAATVNTAQVGLAATAGAQIAPATTLVNNLAGSFDSAKLSIDGAKDSLRDYTNYLFELVPARQQEQVKAWESVREAVSGAADAVSSYRSILESLTSAAKDAASAGVALPEFATGGVVGGPIGSPRLAIVHGGEAILTPSQQRRGMGGGGVYIENLNVTQLPGEDGRAFAARVADVLAARTAEARRRG